MPAPSPSRTSLLTVLALIAFAGNSILCRLALREDEIDPATFTVLRMASGAVVLLPVVLRVPGRWDPLGGLALLAYALGFSFAYVSLDAGVGALLLFGAVQFTMIAAALLRGERLGLGRWLGLLTAAGGVYFLLSPGRFAPDGRGAAFMCAAGVAWGLYTLRGRGTLSPAASTARNFLLAAPLSVAALLIEHGELDVTRTGALLACASGALTSGLGYVLWYAALPGLSRSSAAVVQLSVPVIAAAAGVWLLGEALTDRLLFAGGATLIGVGVALLARPPGDR